MVSLPFSQLDVVLQRPNRTGYTHEPHTIGNHIRNKRLLRGVSQREVSRFIGVSYKQVTHWELRGVFPPFKYFPKIIEFLGYNPLPIGEADSIAGKINLCCIYKGLSRFQLSRQLGIDLEKLTKWESGQFEPGLGVKEILELMVSEIKRTIS